jgi:hypothetical protein
MARKGATRAARREERFGRRSGVGGALGQTMLTRK